MKSKVNSYFNHDFIIKPKNLMFILIVLLSLLVSLTVSPNVEANKKESVTIYINLWENQLYVLERGEVIKQYSIAAGKDRTPSPIGQFKIIDKSKDWGSGFGTRWLGLNVPWGIYGIHGTNKPDLIGKNVSSGCIRLRNEDIEELYTKVIIGTDVYIDGPITGHGEWEFRNLAVGSKGNLVQNRLKAAGFYYGTVDGIYDKETEDAVKRFQKSRDLKVTGQVSEKIYIELGILE